MIDFGQIGQITKTLKTTSAAVPSLVLGAIFGPACVAGAVFADGAVAETLVWLATAAFGFPALQITFFSFADRDRLQNEEHIENKLLIAQGKPVRGDASTLIVEDAERPPVQNPMIEGGHNV